MINPDTGRSIKIGGPTYKKLQQKYGGKIPTGKKPKATLKRKVEKHPQISVLVDTKTGTTYHIDKVLFSSKNNTVYMLKNGLVAKVKSIQLQNVYVLRHDS